MQGEGAGEGAQGASYARADGRAYVWPAWVKNHG